MKPDDLKQAKELAGAATPGPWFTVDAPWGDGTLVNAGNQDPHSGKLVCDCSVLEDWEEGDEPRSQEDAAFIAAARVLVPRLVGYVEELQQRCLGLMADLAKALPTEDERQILRWIRQELSRDDAGITIRGDIRLHAAIALINRLLSQKVNHNG